MKPTIEVFIGSPLVGEEARFLVRLCSDLSRSQTAESFVVLANFQIPTAIKSGQVDFVVLSDSNRGLVELKCLHGPVSGGENGIWTLRNFSGQTVPYPGENPWSQTVQAKFALSDAMLDFCKNRSDVPKPLNQSFYKEFDATLCISPRIHPESRITAGNFKAWVRGYEDFLTQFNKRTISSNWTLVHWKRLAIEGLSLRLVPLNQAIDPDALVAADSVLAYCEALGSSIKQLGSVRAWPKGQVYGEELVQALSNFESVMVVGPSGCGKSFHLSHAVLRAMESDEVPIVVRPKWYRGAEFWTLLQRAIVPYHRGSVKSFLSNVLTCGKQPLLVVDGLNECSSDLIDDLHHGIRGFLTQFGGRLLIAGQSKSGLFSELAVRVLEMNAPSLEQKCAIYECYSSNSPDKGFLANLTNAYDVLLAAKCAGGYRDMPPRAALYDRYCRAHLPNNQQTLCLALLRRVAEEIDSDISLSISRDRFDRVAESFVESEGVSLSIVDQVLRTRLLDVTDNAISFEHELLLNYFRAECLRRRCTEIDKLEKELIRPVNRDLLEFVLPRLSEASAIARALSTCHDPIFIKRCLEHGCGDLVFQIVSEQCLHSIDGAIEELPRLGIRIETVELETGKRAVTWADVEGNRAWTEYEGTLFRGILENIADEEWHTRVVALYEITETALIIASETTGKREGFKAKAVCREALRCLCYMSSESVKTPGLNLIRRLRTHSLSSETKPKLPELLNKFITLFNGDHRRIFSLTGAVHCCQEMCHSENPPSPDVCLDLLRQSFDFGTPLTKTDALMLLRSIHTHVITTCPDRIQTIKQVLESLDTSDPLVNTDILEVMAAYDALEPIVSPEDATAEFRKFINPTSDFLNDVKKYSELCPESAPDQILASGAYGAIGRIFEDIFQGAYYEAYYLLSDDEKADVLNLAANAERSAFYKDWIFAELLRLNQPSSVNVFSRFARTLDAKNPFLNESISTFIMSVLGCSRFLEELPDMHCGDRIDERAWLLIGKIIFWHERRQKDEVRARQHLSELWALVQGTVALAIPDVLRHLHLGAPQHLVPSPPNLIGSYPEEIRPILEEGLRNPRSMTSLWLNPGVTNRDAIYFTISTLSQIGDRKSADVIATLVDDALFGEDAVRAVRVLRSLHQS